MNDFPLHDDMEELSSAEDFFNYFEIEFDQTVVHVNRLHILQRFHDYMSQARDSLSGDESEDALRMLYSKLLTRAYQDFVESDAVTEKVFKVFRMNEPQTTFVPLDQIMES